MGDCTLINVLYALFNILVYPGLLTSYLSYLAVLFSNKSFTKKYLYRIDLVIIYSIALLFTPISQFFPGYPLSLLSYLVLLYAVIPYSSREEAVWYIYNIFFNVLLVAGFVSNSWFTGNIFISYSVFAVSILLLYLVNSNWFYTPLVRIHSYYVFLFSMINIMYMYGFDHFMLLLVSLVLALIVSHRDVNTLIYRRVKGSYSIVFDKYLTYSSAVFLYVMILAVLGYYL